ncbi:MAG: hypothetical protein LUH58_11565 [Lachnospiraceae bacterium]|nr:hypothetical protein [Lachnospiraceae bacterium]
MKKILSETTNDKKFYVLFETDTEGIRQYNALPDDEKAGTSLCKMHVEGKTVPAIKAEVSKQTYDAFKRDQWMEEYHYKTENRCIISGANGKSRICPGRIPNPEYDGSKNVPKTIVNDCSRCPYSQMFKSFKGKVLFSSLTLVDEQGNEDPFEPAATMDIYATSHYMSLLYGWIAYIKEHYPKYARYTELVELLGHEFTLKEAAAILDKPQRTLYGWTKTLRPIFTEYMQTVDNI